MYSHDLRKQCQHKAAFKLNVLNEQKHQSNSQEPSGATPAGGMGNMVLEWCAGK